MAATALVVAFFPFSKKVIGLLSGHEHRYDIRNIRPLQLALIHLQFPGWMNFVKEVHLMVSTDVSPCASLEVQRRTQRRLDTTSHDSLSLAKSLNNLGKKRFDQFSKTGRMEDLEASIRHVQQAVNITPQGHQNLAEHLQILGNQLKNRFNLTGRMEDLDESIRWTQQAVDITSRNHRSLAVNLSNLGTLLHTKFESKAGWKT